MHALNSQTRDVHAPLDEQQCRHAVKMLRRAERTGGRRSPVRYVGAATEEAVSTADDVVVDRLLGEGWEPGQIALMTTRSRHPVQKEQVGLYGYDGYWDEFLAATDVFYGHVLNFKGLERPVVVLAINGFESAGRAAQLLYVGFSRARSLLVVVGDQGEIWDAGGGVVLERVLGST